MSGRTYDIIRWLGGTVAVYLEGYNALWPGKFMATCKDLGQNKMWRGFAQVYVLLPRKYIYLWGHSGMAHKNHRPFIVTSF